MQLAENENLYLRLEENLRLEGSEAEEERAREEEEKLSADAWRRRSAVGKAEL